MRRGRVPPRRSERMALVNPRLVMLGPAPGTYGAIAGLLEIYREQGLFKRWPIEFVATCGEGAAGTLGALRKFAMLLVEERNLAVHVHASAGKGFWREALFMALAAAARCPFILHLHGAGFERFYEDAGAPGRHALRFFFENAACVVVPCESLRTWMRGVARRAQVACVPNPVVALGTPAQPRALPRQPRRGPGRVRRARGRIGAAPRGARRAPALRGRRRARRGG